MTEESKKQNQLLETTDYLEAIGTLKSTKNFFFFISLLCLFVLQGCFWLMILGYVETQQKPGGQSQADSVVSMLFQLAGTTEQNITASDSAEKIEKTAVALTADANAAEANEKTKTDSVSAGSYAKISFAHLSWFVRFCNFILILCAVIYSLSLLFGLKISLIGRLGGINHVTKAFFASLFMLAFLLPWQLAFGGVIAGAIYTPGELLARYSSSADGATIAKVTMFVRFTGLWLIVMMLFISAQFKSMRWSRNILKRLGIAG